MAIASTFRIWKSTIALLAALVALAGFIGVSGARERHPPKTEAAFTRYVAREFEAAMPGVAVTIKAPLVIDVGNDDTTYLGRTYEFCQRDPDHCEMEIRALVASGLDTANSARQNYDPAKLRVVIRSAQLIADIEKAAQGRPEWQPVARRITGDLWEICAFDQPNSIAYANMTTLKSAGIDPQKAMALAERNTAAELGTIAPKDGEDPAPGVKVVTGDAYESSLFLFHDLWAPIARQNGGRLLVALPGDDAVFYADAGSPDALTTMRQAVDDTVARLDRPLAATIFRWTPTGWEVASAAPSP